MPKTLLRKYGPGFDAMNLQTFLNILMKVTSGRVVSKALEGLKAPEGKMAYLEFNGSAKNLRVLSEKNDFMMKNRKHYVVDKGFYSDSIPK